MPNRESKYVNIGPITVFMTNHDSIQSFDQPNKTVGFAARGASFKKLVALTDIFALFLSYNDAVNFIVF